MRYMDIKKRVQFNSIHASFLIIISLLFSPSFVSALEESAVPRQDSFNNTYDSYNIYGPVKNNEGLWDISKILHPYIQSSNLHIAKHEISIPQIAVAILEKNKKAFIKQNINGLLVGSILKIPTIEEIQKRTKQEAFSLFLQHWEIWKEIDTEVIDNKVMLSSNNIASENKPVTQKIKNNSEIIESIQPIVTSEKIISKKKVDNDDILAQTSFEQAYTKSLHQVTMVISRLQEILKHALFSESLYSKSLLQTLTAIIFLSLLSFVFLIWSYKREENKYIEILPSNLSNNDDIEQTFDASINKNIHHHLKQTKNSDKANNAFSEEIIPHQTDITKFIVQKKKQNFNKNVLENAFENVVFHNTEHFIQVKQDDSTNTGVILDKQLLNSIDEIRFVNEKAKTLKMNTFLNFTQVETLSDEMLFSDFNNIIKSKKIDIFIQEFEDVMSKLENHTLEANQHDHEQESLLHFKSSIHFIKILSEMMQANYLKRFSMSIIEILDDILDGKIKMTTDINHRLSFVVNFYTRYIYSLKKL
ncbi:MAG: hypothetical protein OQL19_14325 [Gammaproteobacteria bacterium]|nr:hypothetical protein [Gammaproteobacteria bacterium]